MDGMVKGFPADALSPELSNEVYAFSGKLEALIDRAWREGYQAGVRDGGEQMRTAILHAVGVPLTEKPMATLLGSASLPAPRVEEAPRAARGSVRAVITKALTENPGSTEQELGRLAAQIDPTVSPRSMGGELRRMRGRFYRYDSGRWFLIGHKAETEAAEPVSSAVLETAAKEETGAPATTITD